jgi:hypothetical protein
MPTACCVPKQNFLAIATKKGASIKKAPLIITAKENVFK